MFASKGSCLYTLQIKAPLRNLASPAAARYTSAATRDTALSHYISASRSYIASNQVIMLTIRWSYLYQRLLRLGRQLEDDLPPFESWSGHPDLFFMVFRNHPMRMSDLFLTAGLILSDTSGTNFRVVNAANTVVVRGGGFLRILQFSHASSLHRCSTRTSLTSPALQTELEWGPHALLFLPEAPISIILLSTTSIVTRKRTGVLENERERYKDPQGMSLIHFTSNATPLTVVSSVLQSAAHRIAMSVVYICREDDPDTNCRFSLLNSATTSLNNHMYNEQVPSFPVDGSASVTTAERTLYISILRQRPVSHAAPGFVLAHRIQLPRIPSPCIFARFDQPRPITVVDNGPSRNVSAGRTIMPRDENKQREKQKTERAGNSEQIAPPPPPSLSANHSPHIHSLPVRGRECSGMYYLSRRRMCAATKSLLRLRVHYNRFIRMDSNTIRDATNSLNFRRVRSKVNSDTGTLVDSRPPPVLLVSVQHMRAGRYLGKSQRSIEEEESDACSTGHAFSAVSQTSGGTSLVLLPKTEDQMLVGRHVIPDVTVGVFVKRRMVENPWQVVKQADLATSVRSGRTIRAVGLVSKKRWSFMQRYFGAMMMDVVLEYRRKCDVTTLTLAPVLHANMAHEPRHVLCCVNSGTDICGAGRDVARKYGGGGGKELDRDRYMGIVDPAHSKLPRPRNRFDAESKKSPSASPSKHCPNLGVGAAVAEWLGCPPPTKANQVREKSCEHGAAAECKGRACGSTTRKPAASGNIRHVFHTRKSLGLQKGGFGALNPIAWRERWVALTTITTTAPLINEWYLAACLRATSARQPRHGLSDPKIAVLKPPTTQCRLVGTETALINRGGGGGGGDSSRVCVVSARMSCSREQGSRRRPHKPALCSNPARASAPEKSRVEHACAAYIRTLARVVINSRVPTATTSGVTHRAREYFANSFGGEVDSRHLSYSMTRSKQLCECFNSPVQKPHLITATNNQKIMYRVYRMLPSLAGGEHNPRNTHGSTNRLFTIKLALKINLRKISLPLPAYILADALSDMHVVKLVTMVSPDRRMNKVVRPMAMLILHKVEEYTTCIQVEPKQDFQKCSFYREQPLSPNTYIAHVRCRQHTCKIILLQWRIDTFNAVKELKFISQRRHEPHPACDEEGSRSRRRVGERRNEGSGEMGDPRGNLPTNGIVRHDPHMRKSGVTRPGREPGSPWWEASRLTAQPPWPLAVVGERQDRLGRRPEKLHMHRATRVGKAPPSLPPPTTITSSNRPHRKEMEYLSTDLFAVTPNSAAHMNFGHISISDNEKYINLQTKRLNSHIIISNKTRITVKSHYCEPGVAVNPCVSISADQVSSRLRDCFSVSRRKQIATPYSGQAGMILIEAQFFFLFRNIVNCYDKVMLKVWHLRVKTELRRYLEVTTLQIAGPRCRSTDYSLHVSKSLGVLTVRSPRPRCLQGQYNKALICVEASERGRVNIGRCHVVGSAWRGVKITIYDAPSAGLPSFRPSQKEDGGRQRGLTPHYNPAGFATTLLGCRTEDPRSPWLPAARNSRGSTQQISHESEGPEYLQNTTRPGAVEVLTRRDLSQRRNKNIGALCAMPRDQKCTKLVPKFTARARMRPRMPTSAKGARNLGRSPPTTAIRVRYQARIVPDDAACRRAFSGYSRFPTPLHSAPLRSRVSFHVVSGDDSHLRVPAGKPITWRALPRPGFTPHTCFLLTNNNTVRKTVFNDIRTIWHTQCCFARPCRFPYAKKKIRLRCLSRTTSTRRWVIVIAHVFVLRPQENVWKPDSFKKVFAVVGSESKMLLFSTEKSKRRLLTSRHVRGLDDTTQHVITERKGIHLDLGNIRKDQALHKIWNEFTTKNWKKTSKIRKVASKAFRRPMRGYLGKGFKSPPTWANQAQCPAGSPPDSSMWESCRTMPLVGFSRFQSRDDPYSPRFILIGSQDLDMTGEPESGIHTCNVSRMPFLSRHHSSTWSRFAIRRFLPTFCTPVWQPGQENTLSHRMCTRPTWVGGGGWKNLTRSGDEAVGRRVKLCQLTADDIIYTHVLQPKRARGRLESRLAEKTRHVSSFPIRPLRRLRFAKCLRHTSGSLCIQVGQQGTSNSVFTEIKTGPCLEGGRVQERGLAPSVLTAEFDKTFVCTHLRTRQYHNRSKERKRYRVTDAHSRNECHRSVNKVRPLRLMPHDAAPCYVADLRTTHVCISSVILIQCARDIQYISNKQHRDNALGQGNEYSLHQTVQFYDSTSNIKPFQQAETTYTTANSAKKSIHPRPVFFEQHWNAVYATIKTMSMHLVGRGWWKQLEGRAHTQGTLPPDHSGADGRLSEDRRHRGRGRGGGGSYVTEGRADGGPVVKANLGATVYCLVSRAINLIPPLHHPPPLPSNELADPPRPRLLNHFFTVVTRLWTRMKPLNFNSVVILYENISKERPSRVNTCSAKACHILWYTFEDPQARAVQSRGNEKAMQWVRRGHSIALGHHERGEEYHDKHRILRGKFSRSSGSVFPRNRSLRLPLRRNGSALSS
ncbi:hypothetical protein PR048_017063 [Dryococelus australis]|uniref:Uncharacterized protein n=1 Tax=Dryococelus australis TaxID=614101 RepID=A0ABQ9H8G6_9NEOP|nr:hypothetical protein PR048_017063 [Dryococelus australis]